MSNHKKSSLSWQLFKNTQRDLSCPDDEEKYIDIPTDNYKKQTSTDINIDNEKTQKTKKICIIILIIALAAACSGLFIKFATERAFVEQQLTQISENNQVAFDDINTRLTTIEEEMSAITTALEEAGATIDSSSSATRESMNNKIIALDKQLAELKSTLEILKESKGNL